MQVVPTNFLIKLSDALRKDNRLENLAKQFTNNYFFSPCFGIELEFYLNENLNINLLELELGLPIKNERGKNQFEIAFPPSDNLTLYADMINVLKLNLCKAAKKFGGSVDFRSKPFSNDYGSSMHYNLSFTNDLKILEQSARSLCHFMNDNFLVFMPTSSDYLRSSKHFLAPTHISHGGNNRTTSIRIPETLPLRLEHRIPSISSDPYLVMTTILTSILKGLKNPDIIIKLPKTYGNAYDTQYNLKPLPKSLEIAQKLFKPEFFDYPF